MDRVFTGRGDRDLPFLTDCPEFLRADHNSASRRFHSFLETPGRELDRLTVVEEFDCGLGQRGNIILGGSTMHRSQERHQDSLARDRDAGRRFTPRDSSMPRQKLVAALVSPKGKVESTEIELAAS